MFKNSYQGKLFTILSSSGSKPLDIWESHVSHGYINRILDQEIRALVLEIGGTNVSTTYIECPKKGVLGIKLPFLVMIVKNLHKYFAFEVTILDDAGFRRRFRVANFQSSTVVTPTCTTMPICLEAGWNQILFNLADFTRRAYNKNYMELLKVKINANIQIRRVYAANRIYHDEELPPDFKLYSSLIKGKKVGAVQEKQNKENVQPTTSKEEVQQPQDNFDYKMPLFMRRVSSGLKPVAQSFNAPRRESSMLVKDTKPKALEDTTNLPQDLAEKSVVEPPEKPMEGGKETSKTKIINNTAKDSNVELFMTSRRSTVQSRTLEVEDAASYIPSVTAKAYRVSKKLSVIHESGMGFDEGSSLNPIEINTSEQNKAALSVENTTENPNIPEKLTSLSDT